MPDKEKDGYDREKRVRQLTGLFTTADAYRKPFETRVEQCQALYEGKRPKLPTGPDGKPIRRSNLFVNLTYPAVDTVRARMLRSTMGTRPVIDFVGRAGPDDDRNAKTATSLCDYQLERNNITGKGYRFLTDLLINPLAILSVSWRYETRTVRRRVPIYADGVRVGQNVIEFEQVDWDDNDVQVVDFYDFWVDPKSPEFENSRYCFHRETATKDQIISKLKLLKEAGMRVFEPNDDEWGAAKNAGTGQSGREKNLEQDTSRTDDEDAEALYELLHYWTDTEHSILLGRQILIADGDNPYWHSKMPFAVSCWERITGQIYGKSAVDLIGDPQREVNTMRNQRIDNVSMALNRMFKVNKNSQIDDTELVSRPGGIIHVNQPTDVEPLITPDVTASSYRDEQIVREDIDGTLGTTAIMRGADPARATSATESAIKSEGAGTRFEIKIKLFEEVLKRMAFLMDINNQQFVTDEKVIRVTGDQGVQWPTIRPEDISGLFDYSPACSSVDPGVNRDIRRAQLNEVIAIALKGNLPVNIPELVRLWLETYNIKDVDRLLIQPPPAPVPAPASVPAASPTMGDGGMMDGGGMMGGQAPMPMMPQPGSPPGVPPGVDPQALMAKLIGGGQP